MAFTDDAQGLEAGTYREESEYKIEQGQLPSKAKSYDVKTSATEKIRKQNSTARMRGLRHVILAVALLALAVVSIGSALPANAQRDAAKFGEMLAEVSEESLNVVLKRYIPQRYQPGVWRRGSTAMEAVHKEDAAAATALVELARRQNITITDTSNVPTTSTTTIDPTPTDDDNEPTPTTSDDDTDPTPSDDPTDTVSPSTISSSTSTDVPTTSSTAEPTDGEPTQTTSQTDEPTESSTNPPETSQSTPSPGTTATSPTASTTSTVTSTEESSTSTETSTSTTSRRTRTSSSTSEEPTEESSITREVIYTTLKPDGTRSTITSNVIVPADEPTQGPQGPQITPDLQDAAIRERAGLLGYAMAGLVGVAAII